MKSTVAYHLRRAGEEPDQRFNRRYDWAEIQAYYDAGNSITQCQREFGFARETWNAARIRGVVRSRPQTMPIAQLTAGDGNDNRLENLELLCPNCHSQTDNFAGRNKRAPRAA